MKNSHSILLSLSTGIREKITNSCNFKDNLHGEESKATEIKTKIARTYSEAENGNDQIVKHGLLSENKNIAPVVTLIVNYQMNSVML